MSTETELMELMELSSAARQLIAHCDATGHFVSDSRAALICGVNLRNLTHTLAPAVFHGKLRRVQHMTATTFWSADGRPMSAAQFLERAEHVGRLAGRGQVGRVEIAYVASVAMTGRVLRVAS